MAAEVDDIVLDWSVLPEVVEYPAGAAMTVTKPAGQASTVEKPAGVSVEE